MAAALALAVFPAEAAVPLSPACALLSEEEAIRALNGAPIVSDGGEAQKGYSDCAWSNAGRGAVMSLIYWSPDHFEDGERTAEGHYEGLAAALKKRKLPIEPVEIGERAVLLDEGSPGLEAYTLIVLKGGAVVQLAERGMGRAETMAAAKAIAGRMAEIAEVAVTEPSAGGSTAACQLLTQADLPASGFTMEDAGPVENGESGCTWQHPGLNIDISVVLRAQVTAYTELPAPETGDAAEPLTGIGDQAYLEASGEGENASFAVTMLRNGKIAVLNTFRVGREQVLKLGGAMAGRM